STLFLSLSEYFVVGILNVEWVALVVDTVGFYPEAGGCKLHGEVYRQKGIGDEDRREITDKTYAGLSEVFVDQVRAKENDGPEQGTCRQVEAHHEAEDVQLGGGKSDARLGRENFYAHHLSQQRVGNENTGQDNEKSSSLLFSGGGHGVWQLFLDHIGLSFDGQLGFREYAACFLQKRIEVLIPGGEVPEQQALCAGGFRYARGVTRGAVERLTGFCFFVVHEGGFMIQEVYITYAGKEGVR